MPSLWAMLEELMPYLDEMTDHEAGFIRDLHVHLDPYHPYDELSERQVKYVHVLYDRYLNGDRTRWDEYEDESI